MKFISRQKVNQIARILICFFAFSIGKFGHLHAAIPEVQKACSDFKNLIESEKKVESGYLKVKKDHFSQTEKTEIELFYWVKRGANPKKTPLLLIHGGPLGNSSRYYKSFKDSTYDGDIIALENRNEGCSLQATYDLNPIDYDSFRSRQIVKDLEVIRNQLYGKNRKWRIFGQSRGAQIALYYLEMYPNSLESVLTHGHTIMSKKNQAYYTVIRSKMNARASDRLFEKYPVAEKILMEVRKQFDINSICLPVNFLLQGKIVEEQPQICGSVITDGISYKLANYSGWKDIASGIESLARRDSSGAIVFDADGVPSIDLDRAKTFFQKELNLNVYVRGFNYVLGTNGADVGSPSPRTFELISNMPEINDALISEGRLVAQGVFPLYQKLGYMNWNGFVDGLDFNKLRKFLKNYKKKNGQAFNLTQFTSKFDPIGGPDLFHDIKSLLQNHINIIDLENSGHEGWDTESKVREAMFK